MKKETNKATKVFTLVETETGKDGKTCVWVFGDRESARKMMRRLLKFELERAERKWKDVKYDSYSVDLAVIWVEGEKEIKLEVDEKEVQTIEDDPSKRHIKVDWNVEDDIYMLKNGELPKTVELPDDVNEDDIENWLLDTYGYHIFGWKYTGKSNK